MSRQERSMNHHLANTHCMTGPVVDITGQLFLSFDGACSSDRYSSCLLARVLTHKNLIYFLNLQFCVFFIALNIHLQLNSHL